MADVLQESGLTVTDSTGAILVQGATDKRMTVLSIAICETAGNAETFSLYRTDLDGLGATTELWCASPSGSADIDVHASYLEQDV